MNDESKRLQEMLERATAPGDEMPADLDAETKSLREGWLALGKLLEDAQFASGRSLDSWRVTPRSASRRWPLALVAAVAASLLLAVGLTLVSRLMDRPGTAQPNPPTMARDDHPASDPGLKSATAVAQSPNTEHQTQEPETQTLNNSDLAWDNSLDEEIETVARAAALARQDWYAGAGNWRSVERGLDEIKKDIEDGTL